MKFGVRLAVQGETGARGAGFDSIPPLEGMRRFAAEILPAFA